MNTKDKNTISANEINKFCYCQMQWYYERHYGRKTLMQLRAERNKKLGLADSTVANFNHGSKYHSEYLRKRRFYGMLKTAFLLLLLALAVYAYLYFSGWLS